ncbi:MAG: hypothetical protein KBG54_04685, partial [Oscillospiraceae bacterium]|nr:hypothetical protein [Oscillospiraceae bacterium]
MLKAQTVCLNKWFCHKRQFRDIFTPNTLFRISAALCREKQARLFCHARFDNAARYFNTVLIG